MGMDKRIICQMGRVYGELKRIAKRADEKKNRGEQKNRQSNLQAALSASASHPGSRSGTTLQCDSTWYGSEAAIFYFQSIFQASFKVIGRVRKENGGDASEL